MTRELTLRPAVGMHQFEAVPAVVALGVCDVSPGAAIGWPHDVVDAQTGALISAVEARAGYDDEGMYVRVRLSVSEEAAEGACARVRSWERLLQGRPRMAALAPVLSDYADHLALLGKEVRLAYPNGHVLATGTFVGIDVFGRATVRLASGQELEFPPEKYAILPSNT